MDPLLIEGHLEEFQGPGTTLFTASPDWVDPMVGEAELALSTAEAIIMYMFWLSFDDYCCSYYCLSFVRDIS